MPCGNWSMEEALVRKCLAAYKQHPKTKDLPTETLEAWLKVVVKNPDFQNLVNTSWGPCQLAEEMCKYVEKFSEQQGEPWQRIPPFGRGEPLESEEENQYLVEKCLVAYKTHPMTTGLPTGHLEFWLKKVIHDPSFKMIAERRRAMCSRRT